MFRNNYKAKTGNSLRQNQNKRTAIGRRFAFGFRLWNSVSQNVLEPKNINSTEIKWCELKENLLIPIGPGITLLIPIVPIGTSEHLTFKSDGCTKTHQAYPIICLFLILLFSAPHVGRYLCCITQGISLKQAAFSLKHRIWSSSNPDTSDKNKKQPK